MRMTLRVSHLQVQYPGRDLPAVNDVSLRLAPGEMGVLIGPSGCGKTSLLRAVAGLVRNQAGEIQVGDVLVSGGDTHVEPENRHIGMVFQDYALFPHLDVQANVAFGLHGWAGERRDERVREVLAWVGLAQSRQRYPHTLSGGQQQRVALARALAPRPSLLLLDEPFSNLDVDLRERLAREVRAILKQAGTAALFVTHDQMEAFALGDVIGVMDQGRLHQWADAYTLYHQPATRFVADFIGHGVFVNGRILVQKGDSMLETPVGVLALPVSAQPAEVDVLLRADDIVHDDDADLKARILEKAFRGSEFLYTLQLPAGQVVLAHVPSHHDHQIGELIGIRAEVAHAIYFDKPGQAAAPVPEA
jgi:iron(III) transport system ATP-binding protein